ncbi:Uncharacterized protein Rs2_21488 [Raphanus sativus]|nr:Uncharacterized protein Rs2_21488 [Raphanus sativus]
MKLSKPSTLLTRLDRNVETGVTMPGVKRQDRIVRTGKYTPGVKRQDRIVRTGKYTPGVKPWTGMEDREEQAGREAGPGCRTGITMPGVKRRECGRGWFSQTGPVRPNSTLGHFKHYFEVLISPIQRAF